ncbi:PAAR domain-containing protein [Psychrobacter sp. PAMC 21119]|uniref:PAAR domain-containing protein n=1 Tax=Psychrobacter sp. PAMC 21119 TaxID=1112209 RepID=UPI0002885148|nr:PAAR domain-containing protein [Psychrobacter sp. PAMC 21119]
MAAYITVGAKTSHGGTVISGSPHTTHNGIPISRKGDKVVCKKCKKVTTILTGDPSFIVDGAPIARGGDVTSCGAKLIASQQSFAESDFDVGSVAQAAPLQFAKSDMSNSFVENDEEKLEEIHFAIEVIEFNHEEDPISNSGSERSSSNIAVDEYNSDGDYVGSYSLADNPSDLLASDSTWYKEKGIGNQLSALASDSYKEAVDTVTSYWGGTKKKGKEFGENTVNVAKHTKNAMIINLGVIEAGLKDFPQRTKASAATAMLRFGQRSNVDFVYIASGGGVKHFGIDIGMSVNVHNGNVYEPVTANANVNTNKAPSISVQVGVGRIISSNAGNSVKATDAILSGQGHSYSIEVGPATAAIETTDDGTTVAASGGVGKSVTIKGSDGGSSIGASKGSTNMELANDMKYNAAKNIIEYTGK